MKELVFGPVPSRRLGFSLGVDLIPRKYCTFDCIYCQVGKTTNKETERQNFYDPDSVVREVIQKAKKARHIDFISLSGSGEPTLNAGIGTILSELKRRISIPLTVITNGSLLFREDVRKDLIQADVVLPSLDAANEATFERINCPHSSLQFNQLVNGLKAFRREYKGLIWLEIMLIKNINDSPQDIEILKTIVNKLEADKVQLNTVTRPPVDSSALEVGSLELATISQNIGAGCEVISTFKKKVGFRDLDEWERAVVAVLKRRSLSLDDIVRTTGIAEVQAGRRLNRLAREKKVKAIEFNGRLFYLANDEENEPKTD